MLKLATLLDNPGEPLPETRYRDPRRLKELGYNGLILYKTTGLSGVESPDKVGTGEMRRWVQHQFDLVGQTITDARAVGLDVYISCDALTLARSVVEPQTLRVTCKGRPDMICPASDEAWDLSVGALESLLRTWPQVAGVVLRFGDTDAARLRYLVGNDIYTPHCPRCSSMGRAERVTLALNRFYDLVVGRLGKRLIARAWNVRPGGMHDNAELCARIAEKLPGDPDDDRFVLSFKFTETDFWRYQRWNRASLTLGDRPIMYELQCQREFEGKGGVPNWQPPLWRDGYPESQGDEPAGLAQVAKQVNLVGLWAWVRGGGWGGPFVSNETWIDANVVAVPQLADNPEADPAAMADTWIRQQLNLEEPAEIEAVANVLRHSSEVVRQGFYVEPFAREKKGGWHPNGDWVQDDLLDADATWRMIRRLPDARLDAVIREKEAAVEQVGRDQVALQQVLSKANRAVLEPMINSLAYEESFFQSLRDLLAGLVAYRRFHRSGRPADADMCQKRLLDAQTFWNHHTQRHGAMPGTATAFREAHLWELTERLLSEVNAGGVKR